MQKNMAISFLLGLVLSAAASPNVTEIAPGVFMPFINLGGVASRPSNYSLWLDLGGRGLDSALSYGVDVQNAVGVAIKNSGLSRHALFVTSKIPCCPSPYCDIYFPGWNSTADEAIDNDLKQIAVAQLDLILLHWPCPSVQDTVVAYRALEAALKAGKTRAIGISNFNASEIDELLQRVDHKPSVNQCGFSIGNHNNSTLGRDFDTLHHCQRLGITYSAYSPLGGLSGVDVLNNPIVKEVASSHNKSTAQIALRWVVQQEVVAVTASDKEGFDREDLGIFDFSLSQEEMKRLADIQ